ncbi:MAG: DUF4349 domain-containing protein [Paludibacter sp.]|nr:DUF4349 domain-containing protein [Paludibacter sp.]
MKQLIRLTIIAFLVISCAPKAAESASEEYGMTTLDATLNEEESVDATVKKIDEPDLVMKKIIKDGRLGIKVGKLKEAKMNIDTLVRNMGGYYDKESLNNNDYSIEYNLIIRVPSNKLEILIDKIEKGEGEVAYKEIDARDVTEEFIDLETRLSNKRQYLAKYQELLKNAKSIKEILDIQEKIRGLEEEIESTTGRLKYLNNLVDYSTLDLNITQKKDYKYTPEYRGNFTGKLKQSVVRGWYGFVDFFLFLISNWAILILFTALIYFWMKYRKYRKSKKQKE